MDRQDKIGLGVGGAFTALVIGVLITLFSKPVEVEDRGMSWGEPPDIRVCDTAPAWVGNEIEGVVAKLAEQNLPFGSVTYGPCVPCTYVVKGVLRDATCDDGAIAVDLRSQWFSEAHAGETLVEAVRGQIYRASTALPQVIQDDRMGGEDTRRFPADVYRIVLAHELLHARGYGHSFTRLRKGAVSHKTGELMHPEVLGMGWGFGGLP